MYQQTCVFSVSKNPIVQIRPKALEYFESRAQAKEICGQIACALCNRYKGEIPAEEVDISSGLHGVMLYNEDLADLWHKAVPNLPNLAIEFHSTTAGMRVSFLGPND